MSTVLFIVYLCNALFLIHTLHATNDTDMSVTHYVIATESSKYYTTTIPTEYDTIYEIYIEYDYIASHEPDITSHNLGNIFETSTSNAFRKFNIDIYNTKYCVVFTQYYNDTGLCSYYQYQSDIDTHIAYGTFIGKKQSDSDYKLNNIITLSPFKSYLSKHLTNSLDLGLFIIIDIDITEISDISIANEPTNDIFTLLDMIDNSLYILVYIFLGLCIFLMFIAKSCGIYQRHDDIRFIFFIHFIVFTLNFFTNSIILTLRIFQQTYYILGAISIILFIVIRLKFDISTTIKSKSIWIKPAFINKRVIQWYDIHKCTFIGLSILSGPVGAISFANCRLFTVDIFFMNIPQSMIIHFIGNLFWKLFIIQRIPEFCIQIIFIILNGYDHYWLFGIICSILCILLCLLMKLQLNEIVSNNEFLVQRSSFLMEISSEEINTNPYKYILQPNAFKKCIGNILNINYKCIELPTFEPINVCTESNYNNTKICKCYGLKIFITVNTKSMLRRAILMKLESAQENNILSCKLQHVWKLKQEASIDDIVMVYDLSGDLVIQRAYSWDDPITEHSKNLRMIQQKNNQILENQNELIHIIQLQKQLIFNNDKSNDISNDIEGIEVMFIDETSKDSNETETSIDDDNDDNQYEIYLNYKSNRRIPSKIHIPDQSLISLEMNFDDAIHNINNNNNTINDAIQLQRVTSDSSVKTLVSL